MLLIACTEDKESIFHLCTCQSILVAIRSLYQYNTSIAVMHTVMRMLMLLIKEKQVHSVKMTWVWGKNSFHKAIGLNFQKNPQLVIKFRRIFMKEGVSNFFLKKNENSKRSDKTKIRIGNLKQMWRQKITHCVTWRYIKATTRTQ